MLIIIASFCVFFAFYDGVERLRVGVFERTREFESCALFRFCGFEHRLSVLFVYPNHRHFEVVKDKVEHLPFNHFVRHIFPNANHTFHARQLRSPEGEQSFDERRTDRASVTLFDFEVARQGFALVKSDFTAYFREVFYVTNGNFASCPLEAERVIPDYDQLSADAVFARESAVREGRRHMHVFAVHDKRAIFALPTLESVGRDVDVKSEFDDLSLYPFAEFVLRVRAGKTNSE